MTAMNLTVRDFMTAIPATVSYELTLADALDRMYSDNVRHLPVVDDSGRLVGLISTRDVAVAASVRNLDPAKTPVSTAMTHAPYTCEIDTPLIDIAFTLERDRLGSVIITENGQPTGIFTTTDALRVLRTLLAGHPVEPAVKPTHIVERPEGDTSQAKHPVRSSVGVSRNSGMVSWFLTKL